ncbi:MAG TPA: hypothetical protein VFD46_00035, partial [Chryseolinea sp.]|nr:hypothetical protein [Chryseolinea sp.]
MNKGVELLKTDLNAETVSSIFELSSEVTWILQGDQQLCYASNEQKAKFNIPETLPPDFLISQIHPDDKKR